MSGCDASEVRIRSRWKPVLAGFAWVVWLAACATGPVSSPPAETRADTRTLHVVSNGWHTGIVIARSDLAAGQVPEVADVPDAAYLEFGWGDRDYYPAPRPTTGMALSAALAPTPSVVHLTGRDHPPAVPGSDGAEALSLTVSAAGLERLVARLDTVFDRPPGMDRATVVAPGLTPRSRFYAAHGSFHLFNNCNTWTARKLNAAGVPVATGALTADVLMRRLRLLGAAEARTPAE